MTIEVTNTKAASGEPPLARTAVRLNSLPAALWVAGAPPCSHEIVLDGGGRLDVQLQLVGAPTIRHHTAPKNGGGRAAAHQHWAGSLPKAGLLLGVKAATRIRRAGLHDATKHAMVSEMVRGPGLFPGTFSPSPAP